MTLVLSNSKSNKYRRCPKAYEYGYVHKLQVRSVAAHLKRGSWLHELLEIHYTGRYRRPDSEGGGVVKVKGGWEARHRRLSQAFYDLSDIEREPYGDMPADIERIMHNYIDHYSEEDRSWNVVGAEIDDVVDLPNGDRFRFIIDLIIEEDDGGLWIIDHRAVKQFNDEDLLMMDSALTRYYWAAKKKLRLNVRGVILNELITAPPTIPEQLKNGRLTTRANLATDYQTYRNEIDRLRLNPGDYEDVLNRLRSQRNRWFRRTRMPRDTALTKRLMFDLMDTGAEIRRAERLRKFPRTILRSCKFDCDFLPLCMTDLTGGDPSDLLKLKYQVKPKSREV